VVLRVATWNVENLFLPGMDDGPSNEDVYTRKLAYLASVIIDVGADVVCLQEVGGEQPLSDLVSALGGSLPHTAIGQPDERGIRVAVMSRVPITEKYHWVDFPAGALPGVPDPDGNVLTAMGRGAVEIVLTLESGRRLRVVTTHLKSKLLTFPDDRRYPLDENERARGAGYALLRRAAEAVAVRVELNTWMPREPDVPVVVAGDMNDEPQAVTTMLLAGMAADAFVDDIVGIDDDLDSRRDAVVPDHAMVFARISWP
jgi:endonuclease/exonuclease/phosphatase family metal-dependent hydrolase